MSKIDVSSTTTKLRLYGLYKATKGPSPLSGPSRLRAVDHAKWKAWSDASSIFTPEQAMQEYCELTVQLGASVAPTGHPTREEAAEAHASPPKLVSNPLNATPRPAPLKSIPSRPSSAQTARQSHRGHADSTDSNLIAASSLISFATCASCMLLSRALFTCFCLGLLPAAFTLCDRVTARYGNSHW